MPICGGRRKIVYIAGIGFILSGEQADFPDLLQNLLHIRASSSLLIEALLKSRYLSLNLVNLFIASLFSVKPSLALLSAFLKSSMDWS